MTAPGTSDLYGLFSPASVAVVGVGRDPSSIGRRTLQALTTRSYTGPVYPVNANLASIDGVPSYSSVSSIPDAVDLAMIIVGPDKTADILREAAAKNARWAILLNAGFSEIGEQGAKFQDEVDEVASSAEIRIVGPNCGGIMSVTSDIALGFLPAFALPKLETGPVGVVAQSGGVLTNILNKAYDRQIGMTYVVSTGNEADISAVDFVNFMIDDSATKVIALYTESIRDPERFIQACRRAAEMHKPIVMLKGGRSEAGRQTAASHTGALATSQRILSAIADRYGVCLVEEIDDLIDVAWFLGSENLDAAPPRRVAAVVTSGGTAVMTADAVDKFGIEFPVPADDTVARLQACLPAFANIRNPIDITGQYFNDPGLFPNVLRALERTSEFDAIVVSLAMITSTYAERFAMDIVRFRDSANRPIVVAWTGASLTAEGFAVLRDHRIPMFQRLDTLAVALRARINFSDAVSRLSKLRDPRRADGATQLFDEPALLTEAQTMEILGGAGVPFAEWSIAESRHEAVAAAQRIGFPIVMKISSRQVTHKSDSGGVKIGISSEKEVLEAYAELTRIHRSEGDQDLQAQVLLQRLVPDALECLVGVQRDSQFGWVLAVGLGGVLAELLADTAVSPTPIDDAEARRMLYSLQGQELFGQFRGRAQPDVEALIALMLKLSDLTALLPVYVEGIEFNPVMVERSGVVCADALVIFAKDSGAADDLRS